MIKNIVFDIGGVLAYYECGESLSFMPYMDGGIVFEDEGKLREELGRRCVL